MSLPSIFTIDNPHVLELMLLSGYNVNAINEDSQNALFVNQKNHSLDCTKILHKYGIDSNKLDFAKRNALFEIQIFSVAKYLLKEAGIRSDQVDIFGQTPLFVPRSDSRILELFLKYGAKLFHLNFEKENALFKQDNLDCVKTLVEAGIDIHQLNRKGQSAIFHQKNPKVIGYLLAMGLNVNIVDNEGHNAFSYQNDPDIANLLLKHSIKIDTLNDNNENLFFIRFCPSVIRLLIDKRLNVNQLNKQGRSPLFICHDYLTILLLLKNGSSLFHLDNQGKLAIDYQKDPKVIQLMKATMNKLSASKK